MAETYLLNVPLKQKTITDSQTSLDAVEMVAIRVDTDAGISGWGFNWNYTKGTRAVQAILDDNYVPCSSFRPHVIDVFKSHTVFTSTINRTESGSARRTALTRS